MKIYMASKVKHANRWRAIRAAGYQVISTWIDEAVEGESMDRADLAKRCIDESAGCDALIVYTEPGEYLKGAFIEIGAALANGKPIYAVGEVLPPTSTFRSLPCWHQCESIKEALFHAHADQERDRSP